MNGIDAVRLNFNDENLWALSVVLALIMFGVSLELRVSDFKKLIETPRAAFVGLTSQFILMPVLTFILVLLIKPQTSIALGMILIAACPGGNISNFLTHLSKGNTALSVGLTAVGTVLTIFMTPINFELYGNLYGPTSAILKTISVDAWDMFRSVLVLAGIPMALGMGFAHYYPTAASRISKFVKPFSMLAFLAFVIVAFVSNFSFFLDYVHLVVLIVLIHNSLALLAGYLFARFAGLQLADQKSVTIETGIQNSGFGLLLTFTFFDGLGGMAIVCAWWGIWHMISGSLVAIYWSKITAKEPSF